MSYKKWILASAILFAIGLASGIWLPVSSVTGEIDALSELSSMLFSLPPILIAVFIFLKNATALLFSFALGPLFCVVPVLSLLINGYVISVVSVMVVEEMSLGFVLAALLPHGIIELPALILGEAAALSFGSIVTISLFKREKRELVMPSFRQNLKYLALAIGLMLPAAVIETYITPMFLP